MMEELLKNKKIKNFLVEYPKDEWKTCLEALLVYSISSISKKYPFGLKTDQLCSIANLEKPQRPPNSSSNSKTTGSKRSYSNQGSNSHKSKVPQSPPLPFKTTSPPGKVLFKSADAPRPTSETLRIPAVAEHEKLKEPNTCSVQDAEMFMKQLKSSFSTAGLWNKPNLTLPNSTEVMKIAEEFLSNPFTSRIAKDNSTANNVFKF